MKKILAIIAFEVTLAAIVGVLTSLVSDSISINSATVWVALVLVLLILVPTSWLRYSYENGKQDLSLGVQIPDNINFSISLSSIRNNFSLISTIIINGALFGFLAGYVSVLLSEDGFAEIVIYNLSSWFYRFDIPVVGHELIGGFIVSLASLVVMRRLSVILGLIFCVSSSIVFSFTHMGLVSGQQLWLTVFGNLFSFLLVTIILRMIYPLLAKFVINFWTNIISPKTN